MIFSPDRGSVFHVLSRLVRLGLGGTQGSGRQFVSWIHDLDFVRAVDLLLTDDRFAGPVNLTSPHPLPNRDFLRALRQAWGQPIGLPRPLRCSSSAASSCAPSPNSSSRAVASSPAACSTPASASNSPSGPPPHAISSTAGAIPVIPPPPDPSTA